MRTLYQHVWYDLFCTGLMNVDRYVSLLARLIEDNEPALVVVRADRLVACVTLLMAILH